MSTVQLLILGFECYSSIRCQTLISSREDRVGSRPRRTWSTTSGDRTRSKIKPPVLCMPFWDTGVLLPNVIVSFSTVRWPVVYIFPCTT